MLTDLDYINYYERVLKTQNYKIIQLYFKDNDCVNSQIVGHTTSLCRQSNAKKFIDWLKYYSTTSYANNFGISVQKLQEVLRRHQLEYPDEVVEICLKAFILYQTWKGVERELAAIQLLTDKDYYCLFPQSYVDLYQNVDIILVSRSRRKWVAGIQIKPSSFYEKETDRKRTSKFHKQYHLPTMNIRYNRYTREFYDTDIENVQLYKSQLLKCEKGEQ